VPNKENAKRFTGTKKCGGAKYRRGRSPNGVLWNLNRPIRAVSSYRLLNEGKTYYEATRTDAGG